VDEGRPARPSRVVVTELSPEVESGRFPAKAVVQDVLTVRARVFADGHDVVRAQLVWQDADHKTTVVPMTAVGNDYFEARVTPRQVGLASFQITGFVDALATWQDGALKKLSAGTLTAIDWQDGAAVMQAAAERAVSPQAVEWLTTTAETCAHPSAAFSRGARQLLKRLDGWGEEVAPPPDATKSPTRDVWVDPAHAAFSAWYELFPRSAGHAGQPGTFEDVVNRLPYVRALGFDILYLPPIHPIGATARKGPNNQPLSAAVADAPGSPWAIGSAAGGHTAVHPALGSLADFDRLVAAADAEGIKIALDFALQCSPDHPWVTLHPEWFRHRADGSIHYAENPPKQYQDIYPLDLSGEAYGDLWLACRDIILFWIRHGVHIFRVDNPHTKPFDFWEWLIRSVRRLHPDTVFLAEAFTRPAVMYRLAQLGFSQSYTYFAWRNTADELRQYIRELQSWPVHLFFRPNFWPNTPDILTSFLQEGGPGAFAIRAVLAATLGSNFGIYGPAFEEQVALPLAPGSEEYRDSEKYQLRTWHWDPSRGLGPLLTRLNHIRRQHDALKRFGNIVFHATDNPNLFAYSRHDAVSGDTLLVVVNLDPRWPQSGFTDLNLADLHIDPSAPFQVQDLLDDHAYTWQGSRNFVALAPSDRCAHVFWVDPRPARPAGAGVS